MMDSDPFAAAVVTVVAVVAMILWVAVSQRIGDWWHDRRRSGNHVVTCRFCDEPIRLDGDVWLDDLECDFCSGPVDRAHRP